MAPEQARGHWRAVDAQSDLYSLGATMFSLATGEPIHPDATTVAELLVAVITRPARPVRQAGDVPDVVAAIIDRALSYDKRARYADAIEMRAAIEEAHVALTGEPIPPTPSPSVDTSIPAVSMASSIRARLATTIRRGRGRTPILAALAAPVVVVLVGAFVVSAYARTEPSKSPSAPMLVARALPTAAAAAYVEPAPPPVAPLAAQADDDDDAPQAKPNASPAIQIQSHARAHEETTRASASNVSRLSRRSTLFDRRY